jgi:hypothetical protein
MQVRVVAAWFCEVPCVARTPFRFGGVTVHGAPLLHARVRVESVDGRVADGASADLLVPKWFKKDPARTAAQDQGALRAFALDAARALLAERRPQPVFAHARGLAETVVQERTGDEDGALERGFGVALLERAVLDATCRLARRSFWSALQTDLFSVRLGAIDRALEGIEAQSLLPDALPTSIQLRHTVGMLDPLREADVGDAVDDDEPRSLERYLREHRVRWLKVKFGQGHDADRDRLLAIARLCSDLDVDCGITLDGNEQCASLDAVADLLDAVAADPLGKRLLRRLAHVEQPLPRAQTFDLDANRGIERVRAYAPLVLDEADALPSSFPRALAIGWRGCSIKNCKGVFRGLANAAHAKRFGDGAFVCGEDLTNLPILALQQDLATMTALGIAHVERNGHHYFRGLDHLPETVQQAALRCHPDLYEGRRDGSARLRIDDGILRCGSLLGPGYGCDPEAFAALRDGLSWTLVAD